MYNTAIQKISQVFKNEKWNEEQQFFAIRKLLSEFEQQNFSIAETENLSAVASSFLKSLRNENEKNEATFFDTNFSSIDAIAPFMAGEVIVVAARPAMGKTQLLVSLALQLAQKYPLLFFSFDLSKHLLANRFLSSIADVERLKLLQRKFDSQELIRLLEAEKQLSTLPIYCNDTCENSFQIFKDKCRAAKKEHGVKLIFIDYLQLIKTGNYKTEHRNYEVGFIMRQLKKLAKELDVCFVIASQLSRAVEYRGGWKRPLLSDLKESGSIEDVADKVIFLYRPAYYGIEVDENNMPIKKMIEVEVAKNKNGAVGTLYFEHNSIFTKVFEKQNEEVDYLKNRNRRRNVIDYELGEDFDLSYTWDGFCPESYLMGKTVRMRLNKSDLYESELTGLQIAISFPMQQAVILKKRGVGNFQDEPKYADEVSSYETLSLQTLDTFPFCSEELIHRTEKLRVAISTIEKS